jgi:hypothetical protein
LQKNRATGLLLTVIFEQLLFIRLLKVIQNDLLTHIRRHHFEQIINYLVPHMNIVIATANALNPSPQLIDGFPTQWNNQLVYPAVFLLQSSNRFKVIVFILLCIELLQPLN